MIKFHIMVKKKNNISEKNIFIFLWQFIKKKFIWYLVLLIFSIGAALDEVITPFLVDNVLQNFELFNNGAITTSVVKSSVIKMISVWLLFDIFYRIAGAISIFLYSKIEAEIRTYLFNKVQFYKPVFFDKDSQEGVVENSIADTADGAQEIIEFILTTLIPTILTVFINIKFIFVRNSYTGIVIFVWVIIHALLSIILLQKSIYYSSELQNSQNQLAGAMIESLINRSIVIQYDNQGLEDENISFYQKAEVKSHQNLLLYNEVIKLILNGLIIVFSIFLFIDIADKFMSKKLFINDVIYLFLTLFNIVRQVWFMGTQLMPFIEGIGQFNKGLLILDKKMEIRNIKEGDEFKPINTSIEFRGVTLKETNKIILDNISFRIEDNEKVAFVGESGSGKTSILKLILGLNDNYTGDIFIGGVNIRNVNTVAIRNFCGLLNQKHYWFNNKSIKENLLYGDTKATNEKLIEVCKKAFIYDVIDNLPEKLDTKISSNILSGGQIQRLCLARLLLRKNKILMCDELGNGLDVIALRSIGEFIKNFENTFIITTHNLYYRDLFNKFFIIKDGKLLDTGTHEELIKRSSIYQAMLQNF
jgi:ABC-type multidrug transport system fused ATPase/permease subunit